MDEADFISLRTNAHRKGMNPPLLPLNNWSILELIMLFKIAVAKSLREGKIIYLI